MFWKDNTGSCKEFEWKEENRLEAFLGAWVKDGSREGLWEWRTNYADSEHVLELELKKTCSSVQCTIEGKGGNYSGCQLWLEQIGVVLDQFMDAGDTGGEFEICLVKFVKLWGIESLTTS